MTIGGPTAKGGRGDVAIKVQFSPVCSSGLPITIVNVKWIKMRQFSSEVQLEPFCHMNY